MWVKPIGVVNILDKARVILSRCETTFGSDIPISFLNIFLRLKPGQHNNVTGIRKTSTLSSAGVSRALAIMGSYNTPDRKGRTLDQPLLRLLSDTKDRRYKYVELTAYGTDILRSLSCI